MNTIQTGCGNCWFCRNGQCAYGGKCYGTGTLGNVDERWYFFPAESYIRRTSNDRARIEGKDYQGIRKRN